MSNDHPNMQLLSQLNLRDLDSSAGLFSDDFVWHYTNRNLPELEGNYAGVDGLKLFFKSLAGKTGGTFNVELVTALPIGEEFVVVLVRDTMELDGKSIALDALVVWRVVDGKLAEAWDIPATSAVQFQ